jgi:hypothetical protein
VRFRPGMPTHVRPGTRVAGARWPPRAGRADQVREEGGGCWREALWELKATREETALPALLPTTQSMLQAVERAKDG